MGVASLLGKAITKGAKVVDGLLDDAVVQPKKPAPKDPLYNQNLLDRSEYGVYFDFDDWTKSNPRPAGKHSDPAVVNWQGRKKTAIRAAVKDWVEKDLGWDEAAWLAENPSPMPEGVFFKDLDRKAKSEYEKWVNRHVSAKSKVLQGRDLDIFDQAQWDIDNPAEMFNSPSGRSHKKRTDRHQAYLNYTYSKRGWDAERYLAENPMPDAGDAKATKSWNAKMRQDRARFLDPDSAAQRDANAAVASENARVSNNASSKSKELNSSVAANPEKVREAYDLAKRLEEVTGIAMDVDHLLPLQGDYVSGLHHQDNLFVLPSSINRGKGNSYDPEKYASIPRSAQRLTNPNDHNLFMADFSDQISEGIARKQQMASGAAERINHEIIDPTTKVGRNAQKLWGKDYERYAEDIRKHIGLLGV